MHELRVTFICCCFSFLAVVYINGSRWNTKLNVTFHVLNPHRVRTILESALIGCNNPSEYDNKKSIRKDFFYPECFGDRYIVTYTKLVTFL